MNRGSLFLDFAEQILPQSVTGPRLPPPTAGQKTDAVPMLLEQGAPAAAAGRPAHKLAYQLAENCVIKTASGRAGMVQSLLQEFSLSSQEGWR